MNINILAGGPTENLPHLPSFTEENSFWIGVDRGVLTLLNYGIEPKIAFGDFDSVTDEELRSLEKKIKNVRTFKPEKDEPDMELALSWAKEQHPKKIRLFGATGGRLDHFFANVSLLMKAALENVEVEIIDKHNILFARVPGSYEISQDEQFKYFSFIPISGSVEGLTLQGFKYPLENRHIPQYSTLCISNELFVQHGYFSFTKGILLVVRSND